MRYRDGTEEERKVYSFDHFVNSTWRYTPSTFHQTTTMVQNTLLALLDARCTLLLILGATVLISLQCCQGLVKLLVWRA